MRMKYLTLALGCLLLAGSAAVGQDRPKPVSLIQLIATPEKFNGKLVSVQGLLGYDEHPVLWVHEEDAKHWLGTNSIRVSPNEEMHRNKEKINHMYVTVIGVFRAARTGTESYEGGAITEIQACTVWSDPRHPISERERPEGHYK
jgi:hypothetical protein